MIKKGFRNRKIELKVVLDQFNSFVAEIRNYNSTLKHIDTKLSPQQELIRSKIISEINFWINNSNWLSNDALLYNSSQNIEQDILDKPSKRNYIGLNLNHHSFITIKQIEFYKSLTSV